MSTQPVLMVLRGNSGSGKSSVARALREKFGYGLAWVEQDYLRRILLREADVPGGKNINLIELNVRYALQAGYVTVLEGILDAGRYGDMLGRLHREYGGHWYYFDLPFEETARRHGTRELFKVVSLQDMREWYREKDLLSFTPERIILPSDTLEDTVNRIWQDANLQERLTRLT